MENMKKLRNVCQNIVAGNNRIFGKKMPLVSMHMIIDAYNDLVQTGETVTIYYDIKFVLEKCGFVAEPEGIGWIFLN